MSINCQRAEVSRLQISRQRNSGGALVPQIGHNVCVSAVVRFEAASCPRHKTLNEDINFGQHVTAPLQKHFVVCSCPSPTFYEPHGLASFGLCEGCAACKLVWREVISLSLLVKCSIIHQRVQYLFVSQSQLLIIG
jgi:hypothetical protein